MQHLQKQGGGGVLWLTSTLLTLTFGRSDVRTCQRFNALFIRSFRSLLKEHLTTLLQSQGSSLFLKTAGWYPNSSHSGTRHSPLLTRHNTQVLSFHMLAHSFALFCTLANLNPFPLKRLRTLCRKPPGVGVGLPQLLILRSAKSLRTLRLSVIFLLPATPAPPPIGSGR